MNQKIIRASVGIVVLLALGMLVRNWWTDYRVAAERRGVTPRETTATPDATATPGARKGEDSKAQPKTPAKSGDATVLVLIDGLNFRSAPKDDAEPIRGLDKGERLDLLGAREGWYQVRDSDGQSGWVSNNPSYTKTERR